MGNPKRFVYCPEEFYQGQRIEVTSTIDPVGFEEEHQRVEIWLNLTTSRSGICMTPEELIDLAKMLYKVAYASGWEKGR